jgi:hypothetical protein
VRAARSFPYRRPMRRRTVVPEVMPGANWIRSTSRRATQSPRPSSADVNGGRWLATRVGPDTS